MPRHPDKIPQPPTTDLQAVALARVDEATKLISSAVPLLTRAAQLLTGLTGITPEARRTGQLSDETRQHLDAVKAARLRGGIDLSGLAKAALHAANQKQEKGGADGADS